MESAQAKVRFVIKSRVVNVEEAFVPAYVIGSGIGKDAKFVNESKGWFIYLEGSHEALFLGNEKPEIERGDRVKITLEKETTNALPR